MAVPDLLSMELLDLEFEGRREREEENKPTKKLKDGVRTRKGRGFRPDADADALRGGKKDVFERLKVPLTNSHADVPASRSRDGWVLLITGIHEEASEEDVREKFAEFGEVKDLHLNLNRKSGFSMGYVFLEYETISEAQTAKAAMDGTEILGNIIHVDFAFMKQPLQRGFAGKSTFGKRRR